MGELTEKEKAQKYDEAIRRAKISLGCCDSASTTTKNLVYDIFPELKNKDEEIRKAIIEFFELQDDNTTYSLIHKKDILAWLEKQADKDKLIKELGEYKVKYTQEVLSQQLENKCEQKPTEWSEEDDAKLKSILFHIEDVENKNVIEWLKSIKDRAIWKPNEKQIHAFIQIYVWYSNNFAPSAALTSLYKDLMKLIGNDTNKEIVNDVKDTSLPDMVEQKPKTEWSEEDENNLNGIIDEIKANQNEGPSCDIKTYNRFLDWLKSLKDRVQPQPKQEWSEEDEAYTLFTKSAVEDYYDEENPLQKAIVEWLKTLKDRVSWKPSKEQMDALLGVMVESGFNYIDYNILESLYNDLKKL